MKLQMMTLSQLPHFLRFSVRMLCLQVFFIASFINSQTSFSYSDSTLFVSEDSYLYIESPVEISNTVFLSEDNQATVRPYNTTKHKSFLKLKSSSISKNTFTESDQVSFTVPKSSHYLGNSKNSLQVAVLGSSFHVKQQHKMWDSAQRVFLNINLSRKKLIYPLINHINLLKIIYNQFSRPPPIFSIFY
ncbi:hypothetical protein SAMN05421856_111105 [Chryseobacterium taichungense]|uniref:Uncharacterized protein n=1 Tax=Chryseobacterium taichungense TaxID=295069 RepID=A0A1H8D3V9_9FLAO|nr:hypothetical protein [Chryseobacterium taichungense]SEN01886.1 hypothetical protein SAMN05421856_111105 [Chryseobacterium taichungense]